MALKGSETAARRYARALLDVSIEKKDEGLRQDLRDLARAFSEHEELRSVLTHPALPAEKKQAVIAALWRKRPSDLLLRLVALLVEQHRIELLPLIGRHYTRLWNARHGIVEAEAVSATPLEPSEAQAVSAVVGKVLGKRVDLQQRVDPGLVGGMQLRVEGRVYDGSVRARLGALRERLVGAKG